ncbi:hypothetical protein BN000_03599 [Mycobacterium europaeum]|uniref:Uncharacterized protein n=1 Tax=Mycobacterium europaeum TaxID=761804 RepID=A0A0U1DKY4_9MYCO|nr:hypothetical protein BN000_03599 [Mycobacterium europaeum]
MATQKPVIGASGEVRIMVRRNSERRQLTC